MLHFCNKLVISIFGAVFLHEWHSLKIRGNFFSRGPPPLTPPCFEKIDPPLAEKKVDPLPWAEGACPPMFLTQKWVYVAMVAEALENDSFWPKITLLP